MHNKSQKEIQSNFRWVCNNKGEAKKIPLQELQQYLNERMDKG